MIWHFLLNSTFIPLKGKKYVSNLAPNMIQALSDAKPTVRATAISALTHWFENCGGLVPFLENDLLMEALAAASSPNIKAEMCGWLTTVLPKCKKLPPELKAIVPTIYTYIEDRNPEVRNKSQELIVPLMMHVGPNDMLRALQKAKPTSQPILQPIIEKARAECDARKPAPVKKEQPKPVEREVKKVKPKTIYDDSPDEEPEPAPVPVKKSAAAVKKNVIFIFLFFFSKTNKILNHKPLFHLMFLYFNSIKLIDKTGL